MLLDEEEQKEIQKIGSPTSEEWFGAVDGGKQGSVSRSSDSSQTGR